MTEFRRMTIVICILLVGVQPAQAQNWSDITPSSGPMPAARTNASAIYDIVRHRMLVFGGRAATGDLNDIWSFDLTSHTWTDVTPSNGSAPGARRTPNTVLDSIGNQMLMWSGQGGAGLFNDVWAFDLTAETWSEFTSTGSTPNIRYGVASVFDPMTRELVAFAGFTSLGRFDDTWRFDPVSVSWNDVSPTASKPAARCLHSASYDGTGHRMIIYGGQSTGARGDTWAFDLTLNTWTELLPTASPAGRFFTAHVYAAPTHQVVIFGGNLGSSKSDEVWGLDLSTNTWQQIAPSGTSPVARDGATGIYVQSEDRMIIFGGHGSAHHNDVWSLNNLSSASAISEDEGLAPRVFNLRQNSPNPFNSPTRISFSLSQPADVLLKVYSITGRHVATLIAARMGKGDHSVVWDGMDRFGHRVSSGVYFYRLSSNHDAQTRKMLLLR